TTTATRPTGVRVRVMTSDVAVAVTRPAVVVGVAISAAVLRDAVVARRRRGLRGGRRRRWRRRWRGRRRRRCRGCRGATAARCRGLAGDRLRGDLLPRRGNGEPAAAERRLALALGVAGLLVHHE